MTTNEVFAKHTLWVAAVAEWARKKEDEGVLSGWFLTDDTLSEFIAALPRTVTDHGKITLTDSFQNNGSPTGGRPMTLAYLRYTPDNTPFIGSTFEVYGRAHYHCSVRFYRLYAIDAPIMLRNLRPM